MKLNILKGKTSKTLLVFIQDSSSTTGAGLTGLLFNSASLTWYYYREEAGTGATQVTLATQTIGTWATGGFIELDAADMPGWYELGVPDAVLAAGADFVGMVLKGATNMAQLNIELQLVSYNPNDAVRLGLTALPNAAAEAAGGLYTRGTGAGQINQDDNGRIDANLDAWLTTTPLALSSQRVQTSVAAMQANVLTAAALAADALAAIVDGVWDEDIVAAHGTADTAGLLLRALGAVISQRTNNATLNALLGIDDVASRDLAFEMWEEILTGATHNVATSAGRRVREIEAASVVHSGTAQGGTANTITLDVGAPAANEILQGDRVIITAGTGIGEHGLILTYDGGTKIATMSQNWVITPDATSEFEIVPADVDVETWQHNVVTASASGLPDVNMNEVADAAQTAGDLAALISALNDPTAAVTAAAVWNALRAAHVAGGSFGQGVASVQGNVTGSVASVTGAVGSVTAGVLVAVGGIGATAFAANAITAAALAQDAAQEIADEILNRNLAGGGSGNTRNVRNALRALRNRVAIVAGVATVFQEDDATTAWTAVITTAAGDPISEVNPAGP